MNNAKATAEDFIDFLLATPVNTTAMEGVRTNSVGSGKRLHDAYAPLLHCLEPTNVAFCLEGKAGSVFDFRATGVGRYGFGQTVRTQDGFCPPHVVRQTPCRSQRD